MRVHRIDRTRSRNFTADEGAHKVLGSVESLMSLT
jgi:hypothetical protein